MSERVESGFLSAFEPVEQGYNRLRAEAGLVDLSFLSAFELLGSDATTFLQGMITNDVRQLASGEGCLAAILTPAGKMIADLIVLKRAGDLFRILCRSDFKGKAMRALSRFIVTDDVEVRELPGSAVGVIGPLSSQRLSRAWQTLPQKPFAQAEASLEGRPVLLVRDTRFGLNGYQLWVGPDCKAFCADWIAQHCDCAAVNSEVLEILRIEAGIPTAGVDYDESNLPLECNLEQALNFTKGCYTGQEIIARVTYRASVSRKLMGLLVKQETIPTPGEEIFFQNRVIGRVTSAAQSPRLGGPIALAYIEKEFLSVSEVELKSSGTRAEMRPLPLVPPNL